MPFETARRREAYNRDMTNTAIKVWELSKNRVVENELPDQSSLDAITRQLDQGLYTTFRTYAGGKRVLGLRAHLQRLYQPAASQHIDPAVPVSELRENLSELFNGYPNEARARVILTKGGRVYIAIEPLKSLPDEMYAHGVKVITSGVERKNPRLKSTTFISASQGARNKIAGSQIFEALLVRNGSILEGMTSNFFYIREGKLGTARKDVLLGVTRRTVLRVARGYGMGIIYKPLKIEQIPDIDEAFLTSSSRGIVPIVQIDEKTVGEGMPGSLTKQLMKAYNDYVLNAAENI